MSSLSKVLILAGGLLIIVGLIVAVIGKIPGVGKLPGDFFFRKGDFSFYFPFTTCVLISVILTIIFNLLGRK